MNSPESEPDMALKQGDFVTLAKDSRFRGVVHSTMSSMVEVQWDFGMTQSVQRKDLISTAFGGFEVGDRVASIIDFRGKFRFGKVVFVAPSEVSIRVEWDDGMIYRMTSTRLHHAMDVINASVMIRKIDMERNDTVMHRGSSSIGLVVEKFWNGDEEAVCIEWGVKLGSRVYNQTELDNPEDEIGRVDLYRRN